MKKELKEKFVEEIKKEWSSPSMQKWCIGELSNGYQLQNGYLVEFTKPRIKKDFCFGAGYNGISSSEDWERAGEMADTARTSEQYFIKENFEENFKRIEETLNSEDKIYVIPYGKSYGNVSYLKTEKYLLYYATESEKSVAIQLPRIDIENLKLVLEEEKQKFQKRLNTYLKKFGLSKINSWTYLVD